MRRLALVLAAALAAGCAAPTAARCPSCRVLDAGHLTAPPLHDGVTRLFVLVPGLLGYGWEWDGPVARLRAAAPDVELVVFAFAPWGSIDQAARALADVIMRLQATAPASLRQLVIVAHSAAGVVAAHALGRLSPSPLALTLVTVGAPFAGMHICPCSEEDVLHAPFMLSISARLRSYPALPPGTEVIEYVTSYPSDPVMHPYWGQSAAPPQIGPAGARRILVDPALDHNLVVDGVIADLLRR
jgi:hypothetical protein